MVFKGPEETFAVVALWIKVHYKLYVSSRGKYLVLLCFPENLDVSRGEIETLVKAKLTISRGARH